MNKKNKLFLVLISIIVISISITGCGKYSNQKLIAKQEVVQSDCKPKNKEEKVIKAHVYLDEKELNNNLINKNNANKSVDIVRAQNQDKTKKQDKKKESCIESHIKNTKINTNDRHAQIYMEKVTVKNPNFHTPWINNLKYSLCVDGRGEESIEEGIGTLVVKELKNNKLYGYIFKNKGFQHTFKQAIFEDDTTILAIAGFAYGTVSKGGHIYSINLLNDEINEIDIPLHKNEEIVSIVKSKDKIKCIKQIIDSNNRTETDITQLLKKQ